MADVSAELVTSAREVVPEGSAVGVSFDEGLYPRDAIYGAAYVFLDRCYVHLDRKADRRIEVVLRPKPGVVLSLEAAAGELENELLAQAWRLAIAEDNRQLIEAVTARAIAGASGPPGLDELLAADIGAETAFDDPLGIAMSWEEKYAKKKPIPRADEPAPAAGGAAGEGPAEGQGDAKEPR